MYIQTSFKWHIVRHPIHLDSHAIGTGVRVTVSDDKRTCWLVSQISYHCPQYILNVCQDLN
jgi:hypothetical protein